MGRGPWRPIFDVDASGRVTHGSGMRIVWRTAFYALGLALVAVSFLALFDAFDTMLMRVRHLGHFAAWDWGIDTAVYNLTLVAQFSWAVFYAQIPMTICWGLASLAFTISGALKKDKVASCKS
jgi:hypothetical protein